MAKTYTRIFSDTGPTNVPFVTASLSIPAGNQGSFIIPVPTEAHLLHLAIVQSSGTNTNFTVELLTSKLPYPVGTSAVSGTASAVPVSLYRIIPSQSGLAGFAVEVFFEKGHGYMNVDSDFTSNLRELYLLINPTAIGVTSKWDVSLTFSNEIG